MGENGTWNLRYEQWNDTGALGFTRNLTTAEIVDQVCRAREIVDAEDTAATESGF